MHEINPVLAGTFDAPDYAPANNFASGTNSTSDTDRVSGPDDRRYTKFDHSDTEAGTATMSFSDLVDMINPLEHIPVVSSVYRVIAGEEINPVSRVVGDIIYGGAFGAASAVFGGVSAIADAGLEQETGKDSGGLAVAALFGPDDDNPVQLADAGTKINAAAANASAPAPAATPPYATQNIELTQATTSTPLLSALNIPASPPPPPRSADTAAPDVLAPNGQPAPAETVDAAAVPTAQVPSINAPAQNSAPVIPQNTAPAPGVSLVSAGTASNQPPAGGIALANSASSPSGKKAFGGVMGMPNMQAQQMAVALSQGQPSMRIGSRIYTNNNLANGSRSLPPMLSSGNAQTGLAPVVAPAPVLPASFAPPAATTNPAVSTSTGNISPQAAVNALTSPQQSPLSMALMQNMMMKALSQYGTVAAGPAFGTSSAVNYLN